MSTIRETNSCLPSANALVAYNHIKHFWVKHSYTKFAGMALPFKWHVCNHAVCNDGFTMSVQAGEVYYSEPKVHLPNGDYTHWEVMPFGHDDLFDYSDDVCGYVETAIINRVIEKHGGLSPVSRAFTPYTGGL